MNNLPEICAGAPSVEKLREQRKDILNLLCENEYGFLPPEPDSAEYEHLEQRQSFCAGKVLFRKTEIALTYNGRKADFPVYEALPKGISHPPAFVFLNFRSSVPDEYYPTEEITDSGFAVYSVCYTDITGDNGDFSSGIAKLFFDGDERTDTAPGKIALWAWAASRVLDYVIADGTADAGRVAVIGHSRLGKTALLAGASDERFCSAISNDSGCAGAALERGKSGERIADITRVFPFWFCKKYASWSEREDEMPFDQHLLLSLIAPRKLYIASAAEDLWADPAAEGRSFEIMKELYSSLGCPENLGRHVREGGHYLSRADWARFIEFMS